MFAAKCAAVAKITNSVGKCISAGGVVPEGAPEFGL